MSGGRICRCPESRKPIRDRNWRVLQRYCNHSAFNGNHYTPSDWSAISCFSCHTSWRTKARYVGHLRDRTPEELRTGRTD